MGKILNKKVFAHLLRWGIIVSLFFLAVYFSSGSNFSLKKTVEQGLKTAEYPQNVEVLSQKQLDNNRYSILLVDREHELYHLLHTAKPLGIFWSYRGGSFGMPYHKEDNLPISWGMTSEGGDFYYYASGYTDDERARLATIHWGEKEEEMELVNGFFHFGIASEEPVREPVVTLFNDEGELLETRTTDIR